MLNLLKIKDVICAEIKGIWGDEPTPGAKTTQVIKTNNMTYEGYISYDNLTYRVIPENKLRSSYLLNGDILIEKSGGTRTHSVGYVNIFENTDNKYVCNNFVIAIRPDKNKIIPKYLFYQMKHFYETGIFSDCYNKTTGIQNLKVSTYLDKKITCPDFTTQKQNISFLDKVVGCISIKKEQLKQLDELVKSRFIEMFGDLLYDNKSQVSLKNCTKFIDYRGKTPEKCSMGIRLITAKNVRMHNLNFEPAEFIPEENFDKIMTRGFPKSGDILFTTEAPLGYVCVIPEMKEKFCVGQRLITIVPDERINSIYLEYFMSSEYFQDKIWRNSSGSTVKGIKSRFLEKLFVSIAEKSKQNTFAEFVKQVDKSKFVCSLS